MGHWTNPCNATPPNLQGWSSCAPAGGGVGGPVTIVVEGALQSETPFACACDAAGNIQGWVFNVIEDDLADTATTVVARSLGFRDNTGAWTDNWVLPAGWELKNCAPEITGATGPVVVTPPDQPCIAVNGTVDLNAFLNYVDGVPTYYNLTGQLDPAIVELLDPCDDRCVACCDDPDSLTGGLSNVNGDCDCLCGPDLFANAATAIGGLG